MGLPRWLSGKESTCQYKRHGTEPWVGKIPREGNGNPLKYSCMGNPRKRSLVDCSPWGRKRVRHNIVTKQQESPTWWCAFPGVTPRSTWCLCWPLQVTLILHIQKVLSSSIVWLQIFLLATSKESAGRHFWDQTNILLIKSSSLDLGIN